MKRILIAGLFHETHTFVDETTVLEDFKILRDAELLDRRGDGSPLGGLLETAARYGWQVIPTVDYRAQPSGTVSDEVIEAFWTEFATRAKGSLAAGVDAIYLVLHGAMVSESFPDVEGEILGRLRALPGAADLPLFGVFDLHANYSARMAETTHCLVTYRENPHTDACAMAVHAADLLHKALEAGDRPRTFWRHAHLMWPPTGTGTGTSPMRDLEAMARDLEREHPSFYAVNVMAGFSFADTPDTGVSFSISTKGDPAEAASALEALCDRAHELRAAGNPQDAALWEIISVCRNHLARNIPGPLVVAEPSDNIGGGAPGDGTGLLRAFVAADLAGAAVCINDPDAVEALQSVHPGQTLTLPLGGKGSRLDEGPLTLPVTLVSRGEGRFQLEDRQSHLASICGDAFDMGPCAVVTHAGLTLLLTSIKTPPMDLGQWRSQGIVPENLRIIGVKAAVAHRRAYDPIAGGMVWVDTPGPCRSDLKKLPFENVRRPLFPLDD